MMYFSSIYRLKRCISPSRMQHRFIASSLLQSSAAKSRLKVEKFCLGGMAEFFIEEPINFEMGFR